MPKAVIGLSAAPKQTPEGGDRVKATGESANSWSRR